MAQRKKSARSFENPRGRVAVIVADFQRDIGDGLLKGLETVFEQYAGVQWQIHRVSGAFEIPLMAQKLATIVQVQDDGEEERLFDVIVALGCVLKGKTYHFELVSNECARGCMDVMLQEDIPVVFEVLACYSLKDAKKRSSGKTNEGTLAAYAAIDWLEKFNR